MCVPKFCSVVVNIECFSLILQNLGKELTTKLFGLCAPTVFAELGGGGKRVKWCNTVTILWIWNFRISSLPFIGNQVGLKENLWFVLKCYQTPKRISPFQIKAHQHINREDRKIINTFFFLQRLLVRQLLQRWRISDDTRTRTVCVN